MIKLNCGVSRKLGQPAFGSRGAAVNLEVELESSAAQDAGVLQAKIHRLLAIARAAVDAELGVNAPPVQPRPSTAPSASCSIPPAVAGCKPPRASANGWRWVWRRRSSGGTGNTYWQRCPR
jgi:hypothetical protein